MNVGPWSSVCVPRTQALSSLVTPLNELRGVSIYFHTKADCSPRQEGQKQLTDKGSDIVTGEEREGQEASGSDALTHTPGHRAWRLSRAPSHGAVSKYLRSGYWESGAGRVGQPLLGWRLSSPWEQTPDDSLVVQSAGTEGPKGLLQTDQEHPGVFFRKQHFTETRKRGRSESGAKQDEEHSTRR